MRRPDISQEVSEGDANRFRMREEDTGPLLPLIWRSIPDLSGTFEQFGTGLKARAESSTWTPSAGTERRE